MPSLPDRIGRYRVSARLGAGGMGEVFLGHDDHLERAVAIKRVLAGQSSGDQAVPRLLTEARAVARLEHPHICGIYEVAEDAAGPFIVMPFVQGQTLGAKLKSGALPIAQALEIGVQIADALGYAHSQGILHRDIKPENVMIDSRGQVRVMDFGLAKLAPLGPGSQSGALTADLLTREGTTLGTVHYMSPEQARAQPVDARSDVFSLGVVLYEMITGRRPFDGASIAETLVATQIAEPPPLSQFRPDAPDALQRIIVKALRKLPDERYQSAADLAADLRTLLRSSSDPLASAALAEERPARSKSNARFAWTLALAAVVLPITAALLLLPRWKTHDIAAAPAGTVDIASLAVLPLVNNSGNAEKEFIADGITESLIRSLSQLPQLTVLSRNTAFRFKGKTADAQNIAEKLHVAAVMTGTITKADDQLVIDIELSDARNDKVILSQRYIEPSSRTPDVEADIAQDVARHLRAKLTGEVELAVKSVGTSNAEAYQLYLRGRFFDNKQTPEAIHQAISYLEQSVALDPSYALAYAALGQTYLELGLFFEAPKETMPRAKEYAARAIALQPSLSDGRIVAGLVALTYDWDYKAAAEATTVQGKMLPEAVAMFTCATHLLESTGHSSEAEGEIRDALVLDPLSGPLNTELGCNAYYQRHYDDAIRGDREALALDPDNVVAYWGLGKALSQKGQYDAAIRELNALTARGGPPQPIIVSAIGYAQAAGGASADARRTLAELDAMSKQMFVDPYLVATIYVALHDNTRAIDLLEKACDLRSSFLVSLPREPLWDPVKEDPRFRALLKRAGF